MKKDKPIKIIPICNDESKTVLKNNETNSCCKESRAQIIKNKFPFIGYVLEQYVGNKSSDTEVLKVIDFVKMYLEVLNLTQKALASHFEMKCSTLDQYLTGKKRLNANLILKISVFTHTRPELWHGVVIKNELMELNGKKINWESYQKYDYRYLLERD